MTDETTPTNTQQPTETTGSNVETTTTPDAKVGMEPVASVPKTEPATDQNISFRSQLPEELRDEPSLMNYKDIGSMAKSLVNAQKELGSRIRIPGPDASKEARAEFNKKLETVPGVVAIPDPNDKEAMDAFLTKMGRPETPEGYQVELDPEVTKYVPGLKDKVPEFKVLAHQLGLNKQQAAALVNFETSQTEKVIDKMLTEKEATTNLLKESWGSDYDNRLGAASDTFRHMSSKYPDAVKSLLNGMEGNNPVVLEMAAALGKAYKESGIITGTREVNFGVTPDEAKHRIAELRSNPDFQSEINNRNAEVQAKAQAKLDALYEAAYPTKK